MKRIGLRARHGVVRGVSLTAVALLALALGVLTAGGFLTMNAFPSTQQQHNAVVGKVTETCAGGDEACCWKVGGDKWSGHIVEDINLPSGRKRMAIYPDHDIVSNQIRTLKFWERKETRGVVHNLRALGNDAVFVDVGANIGWFTLNIAYAGFRVIAIEPFESNLELLRHSLCIAPPEVRERVTLIPYGLAANDGGRCELWQNPKINFGDTFVVCVPNSEEANKLTQEKNQKLGHVDLMSLDSLIRNGKANLKQGDKVIMKMDTEGYEPYAIQGASMFIRDIHPRIILTEFSIAMIKRAALSMNFSTEQADALPDSFLDNLTTAGYKFSRPQKGPDNVIHQLTLTT